MGGIITDCVVADRPNHRSSNNVFSTATDAERDLVRSHLAHILASAAFQNSKRYSAVLKYLVDQTLDGAGDRLKERTIGIDVFNRTPDYDTAADHAVRSAVAEVRKRLAQYYQQNPADPLRIELMPGSYTPQFRHAEDPASSLPVTAEVLPNLHTDSPLPQEPAKLHSTWRSWLIAAGSLLLVAAVVGISLAVRANDPIEDFWGPVLASRAPVLLCLGNLEGGRGLVGSPSSLSSSLSLDQFHVSEAETVHVYDAMTLAKFAGLMQSRGKQIQLASQSDATFADLQKGPAILVGLMNNNWTERLMPKLRYTVQRATPSKVVIFDRNNPSNTDWAVDYSISYLDLTRDYALVLRMIDPKTDQVVVVAAGITVFGTFAAGDFLTDKNALRKLASIAPPGWQKKNMEIVLATDVIRGRSGRADIVAAQFW